MSMQGTLTGKKRIQDIINEVKNNPERITQAVENACKKNSISQEDELVLKSSILAFAIESIIPESELDDLRIIFIDKDEKSYKFGDYARVGKTSVVRYITKEFYPNISIEELLYYLHAFGHELLHARQSMNAENGVENTATLMYCLEKFIKDKFPQFYKDNYRNLFMEVEAEMMGFLMTVCYMKKYHPAPSEKMDEFTIKAMDHYKPAYKNYEDIEYVKNYLRELISLIENDDSLKAKISASPYNKTLRQVFDWQGRIYRPSYFASKLAECNNSEDGEYLYSKKVYYEILKEISSELWDRKRLYKVNKDQF